MDRLGRSIGSWTGGWGKCPANWGKCPTQAHQPESRENLLGWRVLGQGPGRRTHQRPFYASGVFAA
jgi:hypothetical protein